MPGNRVKELEAKVAELESTVGGLTEELVEAKERIRDLEAELQPEPADGSQFPEADPEEVAAATNQVESELSTAPERVDSGKKVGTDSRDESVGPDPETTSDAGSESESESESEPGDDIIIA
jgi:chromosome segregation ATPase